VPKLRIDDDELPDELDEVEYDKERRDYEKYEGEQPPKDTYLLGYVKNVWWTENSSGARMLKVLWIADGNTGDTAEYNGLDVWENLTLTGNAKFKWGPFFEYFGLTIRLLKTKTIYDDDNESNLGVPITKIGSKFVPGEDCRVAIITSREKYNGNWQTHVAEWLDEEEPEEEEVEDEELEEEELEEEEDVEDEDEEDEEPEPPARRRPAPAARPTAKRPAAASTTKTSARPKAAASASAKSPAAKTATKKPATRPASTKRRSAAVDDDPPF
jgi:hypothetical protein